MRYHIDQVGILKTMDVVGHERVIRSSIGPTKEYLKLRPERMKKNARRAAKCFWEKKRAQIKQRGTRRLMTLEKAGKFLGLKLFGKGGVNDLVEMGILQGYYFEKPPLVYASSVEAYKRKNR
jgi:hypothetical protein